MSYDFECFILKKPWFAPKTESGEDWQIVVEDPVTFQAEDFEDELLKKIKTRRVLIRIHLEGDISESVENKATQLLQKMITKYDAVILDLQSDEIWSRSGQDKLSIKVQKVEEKIITMSFYFDDNTPFDGEKKTQFYEILDNVLPKALPRRYGSCEPLAFKLSEMGKEHFLALWNEDSSLFWRGTPPFQWVLNSIYDQEEKVRNVWDKKPKPFICSRFEFQLSSKILDTKKDLAKLLELQVELSKFLDVFYSQISLGEVEIMSRWRGLPRKKPLSAIIGHPYSNVWPQFKENSRQISDNMFFREEITAEGKALMPPEALVQPEIPEDNPLNSAPPVAANFPFEMKKI